MKNTRVFKNAVSSALIYGGLLVFNIIASKVLLAGYGSEVNGLLSSVNQLFSYIALLEAGIGTATITALYKPLVEKNGEKVGNVLSSSRKFYNTSAKWYAVCVVAVSFVWPFLIDTTISPWIIRGVILIQGISGILTFCYTATITNYMVASGRNYINNNIHISTTLLAYLLKILICYTNMNILFVSVSLVAVNLIKCLLYRVEMKKYCPEYYIRRKADMSLLKQRNSFLAHEISGVIFASTDTIILSIFCGLEIASVYAVYAMVFTALTTIVGQVFSGTNYILGESYSKDKKNYPKTHDVFNGIYICAVFMLFTVAYLFVLPFVALYTKDVSDANYLDGKLPLLFTAIQLLSSCRIVDNQLIRISLHAKRTIKASVIESVINIFASLILVQFIGIYGVLCGTILALLYRTNDIILYTNRTILQRSAKKEYVLYGSNIVVFAVFALLREKIMIEVFSYTRLVAYAVVGFALVAVVYLAMNIIINPEFKGFIVRVFARKNRVQKT
jgi:O-antigen/teichoic acid export membrane protein